jgi:hypothetical protein
MKDERGAVAVELPAAIGLLLVPLALLVITVPSWPERQTVARSAASEAARTAVLAGSWQEGIDAGTEVVALAAQNYNLAPADLTVSWEGAFARGESITATVTVRMPALVVPGLTTVDPWTWSTSHTERVDDYRSLP